MAISIIEHTTTAHPLHQLKKLITSSIAFQQEKWDGR
jgi:hypothetical protein